MTGPGGLLELAVAVAAAAGRLLADERPAGRPEVVAVKSSPTDVVTEMDRRAEALIRERIWAERPRDAILGEEGGEASGDGGVRWIVDPLDGTVNYLYGLADWAVSIAAEADGTVLAGVVCAPRRGVMFTAALGGGAWRRDIGSAGGWPGGAAARLRCNSGVPLARALVATGFGYAAARRRAQGAVVGGLLPLVRDIRRGGSCAVDLCSVASGSVDAYYERGVHIWDIAAGTLIAREAGAEVTGLRGAAPGEPMVMAAAPALRQQLDDALAGLGAGRDG